MVKIKHQNKELFYNKDYFKQNKHYNYINHNWMILNKQELNLNKE